MVQERIWGGILEFQMGERKGKLRGNSLRSGELCQGDFIKVKGKD